LNHIELFAGCGGLSLGLESVDFELVLANELSPMASETFAYNFFNEDLEEKANQNQLPDNVLWLNSSFKDLKPRLRENPFEYPRISEHGFSDIPEATTQLNGKLVVGSVIELNQLLQSNPQLVVELHNAFGRTGGLDLVSGGPPCQSFSMAGKREKNSDKNTLPWEFAKFVDLTQPKLVLLENVTGILRPFKNEEGNSFHAWYEVAKVFASIGYIPLCLHINARQSGVAQNRPRFILIGIRSNHFELVQKNFSELENRLFEQSLNFYTLVHQHEEKLGFGHLKYFDSSKTSDLKYFNDTFLQPLVNNSEVSVKNAIDDLKVHNPQPQSDFVIKLNQMFQELEPRA